MWGTCLGYEGINVILSEDYNNNLLQNFSNLNVKGNIIFKPGFEETSVLWHDLPKHLIQFATDEAPFYYYHHFGVTPKRFRQNKAVNHLFSISSYGQTANNGTLFVNSIEGRKGLPIYGTQFHLEKSGFEWRKDINASHH